MSFTPEQITEILQIYFDNFVNQTYTGMRYVPIFGRRGEASIDWDNSEPYEPLTIVIYNNESYTSRQFVPAGAAITDTDYWAKTGAYNAQIIALQDALPIAQFDSENTVKDYIDELGSFLPASDFDNDNTVKAYIDGFADLLPSNAFDSINTVRGALNGRVRAFETVADMAAATDLAADMICHTNGFHTSGDGGAAFYEIKSSGTANAMDIIACQDSLLAHLVITEPFVTPEMFGAYGDGTHDDSAAFEKALENSNTIKCTKSYITSNIEINENTKIIGNATIKNNNSPCFKQTSNLDEEIDTKIIFDGITFEGTGTFLDFSTNGLYDDARYLQGIIIRNCKFISTDTITATTTAETKATVLQIQPAIKCMKFYDSIIEKCYFKGCECAIMFHGADLNTIENNRFVECGYNYVNIRQDGSREGSSNVFKHNDVLAWKKYGGVYIDRGNNDIVSENYFECYTTSACCVYANDTINLCLIRNRIDDNTQNVPVYHLLPNYFTIIDGIEYIRSTNDIYIKVENTNAVHNTANNDSAVYIDNIPFVNNIECNLQGNKRFSVANISHLIGGVLSQNEWPPISGNSFINSADYGVWAIKPEHKGYNHKVNVKSTDGNTLSVYCVISQPNGTQITTGTVTESNPLSFNGDFPYFRIQMKTWSNLAELWID